MATVVVKAWFLRSVVFDDQHLVPMTDHLHRADGCVLYCRAFALASPALPRRTERPRCPRWHLDQPIWCLVFCITSHGSRFWKYETCTLYRQGVLLC